MRWGFSRTFMQPRKDGFSNGVRELREGAKALGLQVFVTELDVKDDGVAADDVAAARTGLLPRCIGSYLDAVLEGPEVKAVLTWGATDGNTWLNHGTKFRKEHPDRLQRPLPFDADYKPTAAFFRYARELR